MSKLMFISLPVGDLARATAFYEALGGTRNPQFSDDTAACMVLSDIIHVMLLTHDKFLKFAPRPIADAKTTNEALFCLSADSRDAVDETIDRVARAGGRADPTPKDDYGFMYGRSLEDPDGHLWQVMWMDLDAHRKAMEAGQMNNCSPA